MTEANIAVADKVVGASASSNDGHHFEEGLSGVTTTTTAPAFGEDSLEQLQQQERKCVFSRWVRSGYGQLLVASYAMFANIGVWNALNTIGGMGTGERVVSETALTICNGVGFAAGFFAGSAINYLGLRTSALTGSCAISLLITTVFIVHFYDVPHRLQLLACVAVICGSLFGWLLASIASVTIHCATPKQRSKFLAINSIVLNMGGLIGSALSLALSIEENTDGKSETGLSKLNYIILLIILYSGIPASALFKRPTDVTRSDGSKPVEVKGVTLKSEWEGIRKGLSERFIWLMLPMFMCSIWHEVTLFNYFNIEFFDVRSRAMNAVYYYSGRILVSVPFQLVCDTPRHLPHRVMAGNLFVLALCCVAFTTAIMALSHVAGVRTGADLDFTEVRSGFLGLCFFIYGCLETVATSFSLFLIGNLPFNDQSMSNRYVGWFRTGAAFGAFASWLIDCISVVPNNVQWAISAALWIVNMICITVLQWGLHRIASSKTQIDSTEQHQESIADLKKAGDDV